jgi:hypothetical protein
MVLGVEARVLVESVERGHSSEFVASEQFASAKRMVKGVGLGGTGIAVRRSAVENRAPPSSGAEAGLDAALASE